MKVKRFVIVKGYKIVKLEEKINVLEKEITTKNQRIDFLETKNAELIAELSRILKNTNKKTIFSENPKEFRYKKTGEIYNGQICINGECCTDGQGNEIVYG